MKKDYVSIYYEKGVSYYYRCSNRGIYIKTIGEEKFEKGGKIIAFYSANSVSLSILAIVLNRWYREQATTATNLIVFLTALLITAPIIFKVNHYFLNRKKYIAGFEYEKADLSETELRNILARSEKSCKVGRRLTLLFTALVPIFFFLFFRFSMLIGVFCGFASLILLTVFYHTAFFKTIKAIKEMKLNIKKGFYKENQRSAKEE